MAANAFLAAFRAGGWVRVGDLLQAVKLVSAGIAGESVNGHGVGSNSKKLALFWGFFDVLQAMGARLCAAMHLGGLLCERKKR